MYVSVPFRHHRIGRGLGGILTNLKHFVKPIFHKTKDILIKPLAKEGLNLIANSAKGVLQGEKPSDALKKNFKKSKKRLSKKGEKILNNLTGKKKKKTIKKKKKIAGKGKKNSGKGKKKTTPKKRKKGTTKGQKSIFDKYI